MRLLAAIPHYPPKSRVGSWLATHRLLARVAERGHRVDVLTTVMRVAEPYELDGVNVGSAAHQLDLAIAVADVVVSHCNDDGRAASLAAKWGKPSVRLYHGGLQTGIVDADLVVFNAEAWRDRADYTGQSIIVHPHTDPDEYRTTPGDRVTLVNLTEPKGADLFDRIAREMDDVKFLGVRGGYGEQIVPSHSNVDVIDTTSNMRDDVYGRTRILLMPSEYETWGMVGVEAMASSLPVIAHPTPGLLESLGYAGIFIHRDDGRAWVDEIRRLDDPGYYAERAGLSGRRSAELALLDGRDTFADAVEGLLCTSS